MRVACRRTLNVTSRVHSKPLFGVNLTVDPDPNNPKVRAFSQHTKHAHRSGGRASGVKAIYLGRMAGLKDEQDLLRNMQTEQEGPWLKHSGVKAWVLSSIARPPPSSIYKETSEMQGGKG